MLDYLAHGAGASANGAHAFVEPAAFGFLTPPMVVAYAMLLLLVIMWRAGVPGMVAGALDSRIAEIRKQLDEAAKLRAEAEALKAGYEKKAAEADAEIAAIRAGAERQAKEIVDKARLDAKATIARRERMATDKIAAAERQAVAELKARAADASTAAAAALIASQHTATADKALADEVIASI